MMRDIKRIEIPVCMEGNCKSKATHYYINGTLKETIFICNKHRKKYLKIKKSYTCYYCGRKFDSINNPKRVGSNRNIVCWTCMEQIRKGKIIVDYGNPNVKSLGGKIDSYAKGMD